jgi:LacI family transcriptional regulator
VKSGVNIRELALLAGVSIGTVDRALNNRRGVKDETRKKVLRLAAKHGYAPDPTARALSVMRAPLRIALCLPKHFPVFYDYIRDGVFSEASRYRHLGVEVVYRPTPHLAIREAEVVSKVIQSGVRGLIVTPGDPAALAPLIDEAELEHNIRVVCVASDDSQSRRSTWVSVDPYVNGQMAAELLANFLPPGARILVVTGYLRTEDHCRKVAGFSQMFPRYCRGGTITEVVEAHDYPQETYNKVRKALKRNPVQGIYVSTAISLAVCRALQSLHLQRSVKVVATDLFAEMMPYIEDGTITASIYQDPFQQGQTAVRLLIDHILHGTPLPSACPIRPTIVMRSILTAFRESGGGETGTMVVRASSL